MKNISVIGVQGEFPPPFEIISTTDIDSQDCKNSSALIILCELNQNEKGETIPRQKLYGIKLAKKLRKEGINIPIVFTSFLSRKQVYAGKLEHGIVNASGSNFVQLPCKPEAWQKAAGGIHPLDDLEMYDVVHNYSSSAGPVRMLLHTLRGYTGNDLKGEIVEAIRKVHDTYGQNAAIAIAEFEDTFSEVNEDNKIAALNYADVMGDRLIEKFAPSEAINTEVKAENKWKILLLDDEIGKNHQLVKQLNLRGVTDVICKQTATEAEKVIQKDYQNKKHILLVLSDYRLEEDRDGLMVHQPKQGYRFIAEQAKQYPHIRFAALSALPRKFLMQSFKHYGVRVEVFSKKDYLENDATLNLLCDQIIELGNENAKALARLPGITSSGWKYFEPFYLHHRNSAAYMENEQYISQLAKEYCEGLKVNQFRFELNGFTVQLKGKTKVPSNKKAFDEFIDKMICRRVAIWYSQYDKNSTLASAHRVILGANFSGPVPDTTAKNQINTNLALSLNDFPWNMTIEEKYWMIYEMNYTKIDEIERKEKEVMTLISNSLSNWLSENELREEILRNESFKDFFAGSTQLFGNNLSILKQFLYQLYDFIQDRENDREIQALQSKLIDFETQINNLNFTVVPENIRLFINYLKILRKRLKKIKIINEDEKIQIGNEETYYKMIVEKALKSIKEFERKEFATHAKLFYYDDDVDKDTLKTEEDWINTLLEYHRDMMRELNNLIGVEFEDWKVRR